MKAPYSWIKEFVPLRASAEEVAHKLTFAGLEVEGIDEVDGEKILEVNVTANRGDCLGIRGLARELAALYGLKFNSSPPVGLKKGGTKGGFPVTVLKPTACPRYSLAIIEGVTVGPSPDWLVKRLNQAGIHSVSNVVDVTNYVLMEMGQPLHAFDAARIRGEKIIVRAAREKEKILTLDAKEYELEACDLVIADTEGPIALAGVMGGKESEVDGATVMIALECAFFTPSGIRRTARRLGLQTESSYRFERRVDPDGIPVALQRAVALILETAGGTLAGPVIDLKKGMPGATRISFRPSEVSSVLGGEWGEGEIQETLERLSFGIKKKGKDLWIVSAPSFRGDVERTVDLIEEVARLNGFDRISAVFPVLKSPPPVMDETHVMERRARQLLANLGLQETVHFSFVSPEEIDGFSCGLSIQNPLGHEYSLMRPTLLPSLLNTAAYHHNHRIFDVRIFELRRRFETVQEGIREGKVLSGLFTGKRPTSHWSSPCEDADFYDLKGIVERVLGLLGLEDAVFEVGEVSFLHPQKQACLKVGGRSIGILGEIHPNLLDRFDLKKTALVFELNWDVLLEATSCGAVKGFEEYGRYPVVERDLALVLDEGVPAGRILSYLKGKDPLIQEVAVFDLYRGNQVPSGKKSLAFSVRIGRKDRTMTDEEVKVLFNGMIDGLKQNFQAEIR